MGRLRRRDKSGRAFYTAEQMSKMPAHNPGMSAAAASDSFRRCQEFHRPGKAVYVKIIRHLTDTLTLNFIDLHGLAQ